MCPQVDLSVPAAPVVSRWVTAECPARLDLAGGWSDTPPICYEHGGAVCNVAIRVNGFRPIGARVRLLERPGIRCAQLARRPKVLLNAY